MSCSLEDKRVFKAEYQRNSKSSKGSYLGILQQVSMSEKQIQVKNLLNLFFAPCLHLSTVCFFFLKSGSKTAAREIDRAKLSRDSGFRNRRNPPKSQLSGHRLGHMKPQMHHTLTMWSSVVCRNPHGWRRRLCHISSTVCFINGRIVRLRIHRDNRADSQSQNTSVIRTKLTTNDCSTATSELRPLQS